MLFNKFVINLKLHHLYNGQVLITSLLHDIFLDLLMFKKRFDDVFLLLFQKRKSFREFLLNLSETIHSNIVYSQRSSFHTDKGMSPSNTKILNMWKNYCSMYRDFFLPSGYLIPENFESVHLLSVSFARNIVPQCDIRVPSRIQLLCYS